MDSEAGTRRLGSIRLLHTIVWAFFAACIVAIPLAAMRGEYGAAALLAAIVFVEVLVLLFNDWRCPLTGVAARYTTDRSANFDICLPAWLARYNKQIFGTLYLGGVAFALWRWMRASD